MTSNTIWCGVRSIGIVYPASTGENVTYAYDATANGNRGRGRLTSVADESGSTAWVYDARGNVVQQARVMKLAGVNTSFVTSYSYTTADDLASVTYPGGRVAEYARNSLGQVTAVTTKATSTATPVTVANGVTWLPFGGLKGVTFGNSVVHTSTYDTDYRLTGINAVKSGSAAVQNLALTWNGVDNITAVNDNVATAR